MAKSQVYWLTGLSNSGKTTLGTVLYYRLKKNNDNIVILDGDIMKDVTTISSSEEYSREGRLARAKRYSSFCKLLSDQGITVVICTISMFEEIRKWNRKNIKGYIEIFVTAPDSVLRSRDKKGVLKKEAWMEFPSNPDVVLLNDGSIPVIDLIKQIEDFRPINEDDFDRDRVYWNQYYSEAWESLQEPSPFAKEISKYLIPGRHLLELGCGNGRDSIFFIHKGIHVTAIDASDYAVDHLNQITCNDVNALFICDDFVKSTSLYQIRYDYIYSRFSLHAISDIQENELLKNIKMSLDKKGILFVEARTVNDELYGKGLRVEKNAFFYNNHYRRFIDVGEFKEKLKCLGFEILTIEENSGFSKTEKSDPVLMRCIARLAEGKFE